MQWSSEKCSRLLKLTAQKFVHETTGGTARNVVAQVKWMTARTGRPELQNLYGARRHNREQQLMFFTASGYTRGAIEYADDVDICLDVAVRGDLPDLIEDRFDWSRWKVCETVLFDGVEHVCAEGMGRVCGTPPGCKQKIPRDPGGAERPERPGSCLLAQLPGYSWRQSLLSRGP